MEADYFTILWWFLPCIDMNQPWVYMCSPSWTPVPPPSHPISQGLPSAPALSTLSHASNLDWRSVSHMVIYMFQCYSFKSSHPRLLPQNPKGCSLQLCLFCCLAYRVIVAAAAAKSLQSCPTLCEPVDGSPPGSPVPGILQARTLEWVAISYSNAWKWKVKVKSLSSVQLLVTPWIEAYQALPSMGFSRQKSTGVGCHYCLQVIVTIFLNFIYMR